MFYFALIVSILSLVVLLGLIFFCVPRKNINIIAVSNLDKYINQNFKKRKIDEKSIKFNTKNSLINENYANSNTDKICYKPLNRTRIFKRFKKNLPSAPYIYTERKTAQFNLSLEKIIPLIEDKISNNNLKFRAIGEECVIETVANSFAHAVLVQENFNMFSNFKSLCQLAKVYKKEAEVLSILVIKSLCQIYTHLLEDISKIKKEIQNGKTLKFGKISKFSAAKIYGLYMFNPNSTKLLNCNNKNLIISSTTALLNELDEIFSKQKVIFKYIRFLYRGL